MMTILWSALILSSVLIAAFNGSMPAVTQASIDSAKAAVELALGLVGVMTFWLGMMRIVQDAGFLRTIERGLAPILRWLFPEVPPSHPAMQAMMMNIASNMIGLGNAATPFGIKAMVELNRLNPVPGVATNAMVLFLAINTSSVSLAPLGVIGLRASLGSINAAGIWLPTLLATTIATATALITAKLLERMVRPASAYPPAQGPLPIATTELPPVPDAERPASRLGCLLAGAVMAMLAVGLLVTLRASLASGLSASDFLRTVASTWTLPVLIAVILLYGLAKQIDLYQSLIEGAKEGFQVAIRIIPFLVAIMVAVGMFRASGLMDILIGAIDPFTSTLGFPAAALPMALLRPLSGSGAFAVLAETMQTHGPDSYVGYLVSTLQGSSETTFYVLAVYFGAVGVTRLRHAIAAGVIADVAGVVASVIAVRLFL
ncbi:MAG TPA: nucleoside recognition domain-containing protein [Terriglobales bacterium]|nr:nucleoside recognition domain-containing protein [Terriglobales bacterium]